MNIVIVGGGTAGWIAALMISKVYKGTHKVTLIESSSLGTIGVGESSTGFLRGIVNNEVWNYGCNEIDFIRHTNAVPKIAISYENWKSGGEKYIEPIDSTFTDDHLWSDRLLVSYIAKNTPIHLSSINGRLFEKNLSPYFIYKNNLVSDKRHGYTFDAKLGADYFKSVCFEDVDHIDSKILDAVLKDNGFLDYVVLENKKKIYGDIFIDASGFSRILSKKMGVEWKKYKDLSLNSALPFLVPHTDNKKISFISTSVAKKYGWMWKNPKIDTMAFGYVYDDNFISQDQAKHEIEKDLGFEINPIKNLKFESGSLNKFWEKNVIFIGLGSNFLEPLEATSIHGTIAQLNLFVFSYLKESFEDTINYASINKFNSIISKMLENFKNFVLIHYANKKADSDFWINMNEIVINNEQINEILNISKTRLLNEHDIENVYGYASHKLFNWVISSLEIYKKETAKKEIKLLDTNNILYNEEERLNQYIRERKWVSNKFFMDFIKNFKNEKQYITYV